MQRYCLEQIFVNRGIIERSERSENRFRFFGQFAEDFVDKFELNSKGEGKKKCTMHSSENYDSNHDEVETTLKQKVRQLQKSQYT